MTMPNIDYLRVKARQCRELASLATMPEVREQLGMFAEDLDEDAAALDRMEAAGMDKGTDAPA
jgi:hypothetical protein